jgi:hypothetical protein
MSTPPTRFLWVDSDHKQAKGIISAHAAREGLRKKKKAKLTHFAKNTTVLKRPLLWRKVVIRPNTSSSRSLKKSTTIGSAPVNRCDLPSTQRLPLYPHNVNGQHSARKIFGPINAGPLSLLSASKNDPFGTYPVSKSAIRFGQLLDFGKS